MNWQGACKRYLEALGFAEWVAQGKPTPTKKSPKRYAPSPYHCELITCLDRNDEMGFKSLKMTEGYASAVGV